MYKPFCFFSHYLTAELCNNEELPRPVSEKKRRSVPNFRFRVSTVPEMSDISENSNSQEETDRRCAARSNHPEETSHFHCDSRLRHRLHNSTEGDTMLTLAIRHDPREVAHIPSDS